MIVSKLPDKLVHRWIRNVAEYMWQNMLPVFRYFTEFLEREIDISCDPILSMQTIDAARNCEQIHIKRFCFYCKGGHYLYSCSSFIALTAEER